LRLPNGDADYLFEEYIDEHQITIRMEYNLFIIYCVVFNSNINNY
jgi:hypothetical protein